MTARKIFSIITIVLLALLIANMFLPVYDGSGYWSDYSTNLWDSLSTTMDVVHIILFVVGILACILQLCNVFKDFSLAYLPLGFSLFESINIISSYLEADNISDYMSLGVGAYTGLLLTLSALVLVFVSQFLKNEPKRRPNYGYGNGNNNRPMGFDPRTGAPMYGQQSGFDPRTGAPIYR